VSLALRLMGSIRGEGASRTECETQPRQSNQIATTKAPTEGRHARFQGINHGAWQRFHCFRSELAESRAEHGEQVDWMTACQRMGNRCSRLQQMKLVRTSQNTAVHQRLRRFWHRRWGCHSRKVNLGCGRKHQ